MKQFNMSFFLTSIILSSNLLTIFPVLAQKKNNHSSGINLPSTLAESKNTVDNQKVAGDLIAQKYWINDRKINWIQVPGFIRGEKQTFLSLSQAPGFRNGINPKSTTDYLFIKIQNPKLNDPIIPTKSIFPLSFQNQSLNNSSNWQPRLEETQKLPTIISQTQNDSGSPYFGEVLDDSSPYFGEIIKVDQLADVSPEHWAYEAVRSLVEKYRCISDSQEGVFNGNRVINRYEFAAVLNACLLKVGRSISSLNNTFVDQEDWAIVQRLQAEFSTELENITAKIDNLEERVALIESRQFSTTTVLRGSVNFNVIGAFGDQQAVPSGQSPTEDLDNTNTTFSARTTLNLDTSFTGKDRLRATIQAGNVSNFGASFTGTDMTRLIGATNTENDIRVSTLFYEFPVGKQGIVAIAPLADFPTRIFPALNPVSSISNFGAESPIYSFAFGSGAVAYYQFTDKFAAGISYLTTSGPSADEGLFNGQYTALTQLTYTPSSKLGIALTYGRYYAPSPGLTVNITGSKGSEFAQLPFGEDTATSSNALGLQFTYKLSDKLIVGGWGSYFKANAETSPNISGFSGSSGADADIWSWAVTASLKDLGKLGSQLSFVFGMPPKVTNNDVVEREDQDTSLHFELSYRYPITDRIFITPGLLVITNPEHNANNDTTWVGLMRTTFNF